MFITRDHPHGSREIKREAKAQLSGKWQSVILLTIIPVLITTSLMLFTAYIDYRTSIGSGFTINQNSAFNTGWRNFIQDTLNYFLLTGVMFTFVDFITLKNYRISPLEDLLQVFKKYSFINFLKLYVVKRVYLFFWTLLFIIPGIIKTLSYSQAELIHKDYKDSGKELSANEAITLSRELMNGHKFEYFILYISFIGWFILSAFAFWLPMIYVLPYFNASKAVFYRTLTQEYMNNESKVDSRGYMNY